MDAIERVVVVVMLVASAVATPLAVSQSGRLTQQRILSREQQGMKTMHEATGTFTVKVVPGAAAPDEGLSRFTIDKVFSGGLEGTSKGEMLSGGDPKQGEAGYVAIERVTGTLAGRSGSFALMHTATMTKRGGPQMSVAVVPGSGTGELKGISGTFTIVIAADGGHSYTLQYRFESE